LSCAAIFDLKGPGALSNASDWGRRVAEVEAGADSQNIEGLFQAGRGRSWEAGLCVFLNIEFTEVVERWKIRESAVKEWRVWKCRV
jgi:hypothetical protein